MSKNLQFLIKIYGIKKRIQFYSVAFIEDVLFIYLFLNVYVDMNQIWCGGANPKKLECAKKRLNSRDEYVSLNSYILFLFSFKDATLHNYYSFIKNTRRLFPTTLPLWDFYLHWKMFYSLFLPHCLLVNCAWQDPKY